MFDRLWVKAYVPQRRRLGVLVLETLCNERYPCGHQRMHPYHIALLSWTSEVQAQNAAVEPRVSALAFHELKQDVAMRSLPTRKLLTQSLGRFPTREHCELLHVVHPAADVRENILYR